MKVSISSRKVQVLFKVYTVQIKMSIHIVSRKT